MILMTTPQKFFVSTQAIVKAEGKVLILHKSKISFDGSRADMWVLPGGKINESENTKDALKRELKEEIGLDIQTEPEFLTYYISGGSFNDGTKLMILKFIIEVEKVFEIELTEEHDDYKWINWEEFLNYPLHFDKISINQILKQNNHKILT